MRKLVTLVLILALLALPSFAQTTQTRDDRRAIEALASSFQDCWNRHDIDALASLMAEDVDYVTVVGTKDWEKGRREFKDRRTAAHKTMFKESVLTVKLDSRQIHSTGSSDSACSLGNKGEAHNHNIGTGIPERDVSWRLKAIRSKIFEISVRSKYGSSRVFF